MGNHNQVQVEARWQGQAYLLASAEVLPRNSGVQYWKGELGVGGSELS